VCETGYGTAVAGTCSRAPPQSAGHGSNLNTWRTLLESPGQILKNKLVIHLAVMSPGLSSAYFTQDFDRCAHLFLADFFVFLLFGGGLESLPGQRAPIKVHAHISQRLHVVAPTLLNAQVGVDGGVPGGAGQIFILSVHNVLPGAVVAELLGEAEVDEKHLVAVSTDAHQEVVGLDVAVDEVFVVHELDATDHLIGEHQDGFHCEASRAEVE